MGWSVALRSTAERSRYDIRAGGYPVPQFDVTLDPACDAYCSHVMSWPAMQEWIEAAVREPEQIEELEVEF